ncbi:hypothetical protein FA95DRAFT_302963 [Auriscalpium vulgare]|uniref:Uncharacterized protein n=1 Tax=Auriscalpium vulgare TaxID=40419 RepID=A0ACB8RJM9_9AGAM|nr:hypothetical protein FA95DRAFT_302963 [Auriscalpium vulgare]
MHINCARGLKQYVQSRDRDIQRRVLADGRAHNSRAVSPCLANRRPPRTEASQTPTPCPFRSPPQPVPRHNPARGKITPEHPRHSTRASARLPPDSFAECHTVTVCRLRVT